MLDRVGLTNNTKNMSTFLHIKQYCYKLLVNFIPFKMLAAFVGLTCLNAFSSHFRYLLYLVDLVNISLFCNFFCMNTYGFNICEWYEKIKECRSKCDFISCHVLLTKELIFMNYM